MLDWLRSFTEPPKQVFLVHGEPVAADAMRHHIEEELRWRCHVPEYLERCDLVSGEAACGPA
jgi:metallo-beta-lactamase family protein